MLFSEKQLNRDIEKLNAYSHGIGILIGVIWIPFLFIQSLNQSSNYTLSLLIYAFSFLLVFCSSTFYHAAWELKLKDRLRTLDHISIYFLIAGTYTPVLMCYSDNKEGRMVLYGLWLFVLIGTIWKLIFGSKYDYFSTAMYVLMGWSIVFIPESGLDSMPYRAWDWMIIGGAFYSIGVLFYLRNSMLYNHVIWHIFVLAGAVSHMKAVHLIMNY